MIDLYKVLRQQQPKRWPRSGPDFIRTGIWIIIFILYIICSKSVYYGTSTSSVTMSVEFNPSWSNALTVYMTVMWRH